MMDMRKLGQAVPILATLALALLVRVWGLRYALPYEFGHVDEQVVIRDAMQMGAAHSLKPSFFDYPSLYTYLTLIAIGAKYVLWRLLGLFSSPSDLALQYALSPGYIHLIGRVISVAAGTLTVYVTYLLGRKVANYAVGLCAAVLMALAVEHVSQSHWALPDATMTLLFTAALYLAYRLVETGSLKSYIACGLVAGLAVSTKYNASPIVAVLLVAHVMRVRPEHPRSNVHFLDRRLVAGALCMAAGFFAASPYWLLDPKPYILAVKWNASHMRVGHLGSQGVRWLWVPLRLLATEKALGVLMIVGVLRALASRRREDALLLAAALVSFVVTGSALKTSLYFFLTAYPPLCILGAEAIEGLARRLLDGRRRMLLFPMTAALIAIPQVVDVARFDYGMSVPDTRAIAKDWIERSIPARSTIAMDEPRAYCAPVLADNFVSHWSQLCPAISQRLEQGVMGRPRYRLVALKSGEVTGWENRPADFAAYLQERKWYSIAGLRQQGVRYIILSSYNYGRYENAQPPRIGNPMRPIFLQERAHYQALISSPDLKLVKTISPGKWNFGPTLLIYRIKG